MSFKLYVGNLAYSTTDADLNELFASFGTVESAQVLKDKYTGDSKGFGFVELASADEGNQAIQALDGKDFQGRQLKVNEARPRTEKTGQRSYGSRNSY
ncbi:MAG: RNA-binding protein [Candidatus Omnitrophica bacterium]|nr:RNA-binding protein [Candidatus Omnitrophota bacterium]